MIPRLHVNRTHGLPSNQVHAVDQDSLGRLWLAGPAGLSCFDGSRVQSFDRRNGLACAGLRCLAVGHDDTVWIGTDLGVELLNANGSPIALSHRWTWTYGLVDCIAPTDDGVWLGTARGMLRLIYDRPARSLRIGFDGVAGFVRGMARIDATSVLVASSGLGLTVLEQDRLRRIRGPDVPAAADIGCVAVGSQGQLVAGTTNGVYVFSADGDLLQHLVPSDISRQVTAMALGQQQWWIAFGRTLVGYTVAANGITASERFEIGSRINSVRVDRVGNIWVATNTAGVQCISFLRGAIEKIDTLRAGPVYSIKAEGSDVLRVSGDSFDTRITFSAEGRLTRKLLSELDTTVWDTAPDPESNGSWLATQEGLFHMDGSDVCSRVGADDPLLAVPCRVVLARAAELWVGTLRGLVRLRDGRAEEVRGTDGSSLGYVYTTWLDAEARLWVGTLGRGLWCESAAGLEPVVLGSLSADGNTYVVAPSPSGEQLLVIQDERIILLQGDQALLIRSEHASAGWSALWLDEHTVAIGSSDGVRLIGIPGGAVESRINAIFDASGWEFTNNRTLVRGPDGRLFCGINAGLCAVDLKQLSQHSVPPSVQLSGLEWHATAPQLSNGVYVVSPGKWAFVASVFATWSAHEDQIRFRFRLTGFDSDWSELRAEPSAHYSSLPPGDYELEARAHVPRTGTGAPSTLCRIRVSGGQWAALVTRMTLQYQRVLGHAVRNSQLIAQNEALRTEIFDRTRALELANEKLQRSHDTVEESAYTDALTGLRNRRDFDRQFDAEFVRATRSRASLGLLLADVDHFKRYNDCYGHQRGDDCLKQVATALRLALRKYDIAARYGGEEFVIILPGADADTVSAVGTRLCHVIAELGIAHADAPRGIVTLSVGGVVLRPEMDQTRMLRDADSALYTAKREGRDRFALHAKTVADADADSEGLDNTG